MAAPPSFSRVLSELRHKRTLGPRLARRAFDTLFAGGWTPAQTATLLGGLHLLEPSVDALVAAARALREAHAPIEHGHSMIFEPSATAEESRKSLHLATGVGIIVAAAGVPVVLQGDPRVLHRRACETLAALGLPVGMSPEATSKVLEVATIAHASTQVHHPGFEYVASARRELGTPLIVDLLPALANPARTTHHLVGASSDEARRLLVEALADLGARRAWVVHSEDGLDAISPHGPTRVSVLSLRQIREGTVTPADFGHSASPPGAIDGGSPSTNAGILAEVLSGQPHPARTGFVINAAASLAIAKDMRLREATALVERILDTGRALATLERWGAACRAQLPKD
jgi:anthranilate phosphoribosyltransferase